MQIARFAAAFDTRTFQVSRYQNDRLAASRGDYSDHREVILSTRADNEQLILKKSRKARRVAGSARVAPEAIARRWSLGMQISARRSPAR